MDGLMFLGFLLAFMIIMCLGFVAGVLTKGININITKKEPEPIKEEERVYNVSTENQLPDEVRDYYEKQKGFMNV